MNDEILTHLQGITAEEQAILDGRKTIDRNIYMQGQENIINAKKLLAAGKLITIRPHTRFIHFPEHTHDYVEVVYMCAGQPGCADTDGKNTRAISRRRSAVHPKKTSGNQTGYRKCKKLCFISLST